MPNRGHYGPVALDRGVGGKGGESGPVAGRSRRRSHGTIAASCSRLGLMSAIWLLLHLLAAIVWIGGMAFAVGCLRPSLATLEPAQRQDEPDEADRRQHVADRRDALMDDARAGAQDTADA